ncbi:TadE/TadG family type IV pilus assembly protein [Caulobacter hibisci]|nr:TadE/TadG family type IV pilus assembly protein [Caulobacter hibisci]
MTARPASTARRFAREIRGAVAVEFAVLAPLLVLLYFGMSEMTQAFMAKRRLGNTASLMGDIAAQNPTITQARVDDIFQIGNTVMRPFATTTLRWCVASVVSDSDGKDTIAWVAPKNSPTDCPAKGAVVSYVSPDLLPASASVIMSSVSYEYVPTLKLLGTKFVFKKSFYLRPRKSDSVAWATS